MPRFFAGTRAAPDGGAAVGTHMRFMVLLLGAGALAASFAGCDEERPVTVLFTGDDRGFVVPAG